MASTTMKNWKQIAEANGLDIPAGQIEKVAPSLDSLEAAFRPLVALLNEESESSLTFHLQDNV